ncbi:30S ribosomal protein S5 [Candidatus Saccharibacteria bacterium]|nr:30S ribosomal protein S5 [Candidatus Saccharibacteria bacterium]MCL1962672.1 30S ribosomal protein S5 [Candidatus Saccharibacteria bacterium]
MSEEIKNLEAQEVAVEKSSGSETTSRAGSAVTTAVAAAEPRNDGREDTVRESSEVEAVKSSRPDAPASAKNGERPTRKFGTGSNFSSENMTAEKGRRGERSRGERGGKNNRRGDNKPAEAKIFEEQTISVDRVSRAVKGGRRFRFKALVVVGDKKNKVGVGVAKGQDVQAAVQKASETAKKHLINIPIVNNTIPHEVEIKLGGARVLLKPAAPGTGIIAGGVVRSVIGVTGITNLLSKSLGSTNKVNIAYATVDALRSLVPKSEWITNDKKPAKKETK